MQKRRSLPTRGVDAGAAGAEEPEMGGDEDVGGAVKENREPAPAAPAAAAAVAPRWALTRSSLRLHCNGGGSFRVAAAVDDAAGMPQMWSAICMWQSISRCMIRSSLLCVQEASGRASAATQAAAAEEEGYSGGGCAERARRQFGGPRGLLIAVGICRCWFESPLAGPAQCRNHKHMVQCRKDGW